MNLARHCLIATLNGEDADAASMNFQKEVFEEAIRLGAKGVVIDVSDVPLMDSLMSSRLVDTCRVGSLLGQTTVIVGLRPAVAAALVRLEVDLNRILTAATVERALDMLNPPEIPAGTAAREENDEESTEENVHQDTEDQEDGAQELD